MQGQEPEAFREFGALFGPLLEEAYQEAGLDSSAAEGRAVLAVRDIAIKIAVGTIVDGRVFGEELRSVLATLRGFSPRDEIAYAAAIQKRLSRVMGTPTCDLEVEFVDHCRLVC